VSAIVLAAGRSERMGAANKLLLPVEGVAVVRRVVETVCATPVIEVLAVVGHEAEAVGHALAGLPVRLVDNPRHGEGLGSSVAAGVASAAGDVDGYLICLGDLPWLTTSSVRAVLDRFHDADAPDMVVPHYEGRPGHPVLVRERFRDLLLRLEGDRGARAALRGVAAAVCVDVEDPGVLDDIDTPEDYERHG